MRQFIVVVCALLTVVPSAFADDDCTIKPVPAKYDYDCDDSLCTLTLNWKSAMEQGTLRIDSAFLKQEQEPRITPKTRLVLNIRGFNFLRYTLEFEIQEKTVDTYVLLERLWRQIFVLAPHMTRSTKRSTDGFVAAIFEWRAALADANKKLGDALEAAPKTPHLSESEIAPICRQRQAQEAELRRIDALRSKAVEELKTSDDVQNLAVFEASDKMHGELRARVQAFAQTERLIREGFTKTIPQKELGRIVTVTMRPKSVDGVSEAPLAAVQYFVESELAVSYHVGLVYSTIGNVDFEQVRTVSGADLFAKIKDDDGITELVAFLSARLFETGLVPVYGTIGTDFSEPGKRLYAGISIPVWKAFLTAGVVSASVKEGGNTILDQIVDRAGNVVQTRELFDTVRTRRQWSGVIGITFRPF